jgi:hypothetical protein
MGTYNEAIKSRRDGLPDAPITLQTAGNFNATGNTANGKTVTPNTDGAAFPTACPE